MATSRLTITGDIGGASLNSTMVRSATGQIGQFPITLAAADAGTLSTRTSDTAGTLTPVSYTHLTLPTTPYV